MNKILWLILACVVAAHALSFHADVTITDDPQIPNGVIWGHMNYYYNQTVGAFNHNIRIDWASPASMTEQWLFAKSIHYRRCTTCFAETYKLMADIYFKLPGDIQGTNPFNGCTEYLRTSGNVKQIWFNAANQPCKAVINGASGQRTIVFTNYATGNQANKLTEYTGWNCPAPVCNRVMDIVLVFDESGSISGTEWISLTNFAKSIVNSYTIGVDATTIGVVYFSWPGRLISYLSADKGAIETAISTTQRGGSTCIGCGMSIAYNHVFNNIPASKVVQGRPANPARLMITLTDGGNNMPSGSYTTNLTNSANMTKNAGILSVAIGVAGYRLSDMNIIASNSPTGKLIFLVSAFGQLSTILAQLVMQTCSDLPAQPCGQQCYGFCSCNSVCMCPVCQNLGRCWMNNCTMTGTGSSGCVKTPVDCSSPNKCIDTWCNSTEGCKNKPRDCNDNDACTVDKCASASGCYREDTDCDDHNACTEDDCVHPTGCTHRYLCNDGNPCTIDTCNNVTGCHHDDVPCDDGKACTDDSCDSTTGLCVHETTVCSDGRNCTQDMCDNETGCYFPPLQCEDDNICTNNTCVEGIGCTNTSIDCAACLEFTKTNNCTNAGKCRTGFCEKTGPTTARCNWTEWDAPGGPCDTGNLCIQGGCDRTTGKCTRTPIVCEPIACTLVECNPETGLCDRVKRVCDDGNPCTDDYCDNATDTCATKPFCKTETCKVVTCVEVNKTYARCEKVDLDCNSGSECIKGTCNNVTGKCDLVEITCIDDLFCTDDTCEPATGCVFSNHSCDDNNPCTLDFCNETLGCYHTIKCDDGLYCTDDICLPDGTCLFKSIDCSKLVAFKPAEKACFIAACSETRHCHKVTANTAILDVCGNCIDVFANMSLLNDTDSRTACVGSMTWPKFAATLTAAAIAGIIIAAIIGAILIALSGFFGTRELLRRAKLAQDQAAHNNPLYQDSGREMVNPAFKGES